MAKQTLKKMSRILCCIIFLFYVLPSCRGSELQLSELNSTGIFYSGLKVETPVASSCKDACLYFSYYPFQNSNGICFCTKKNMISASYSSVTLLNPCLLETESEVCELVGDPHQVSALEVVFDVQLVLPSSLSVPDYENMGYNISRKSFSIPPSQPLDYNEKFDTVQGMVGGRIFGEPFPQFFLYSGYIKSYITSSWITGMQKTYISHFSSQISNIKALLGKFLADDSNSKFFLMIGGGTNVTFTFNNPLLSSNIVPDMSANMIADIYITSSGDNQVTVPYTEVPRWQKSIIFGITDALIIKGAVAHEQGILKGLHMDVERPGVILFAITRPVCGIGEYFSIFEQTCGSTYQDFYDEDLMIERNISNIYRGDGKIIHVILVSITVTGLSYYEFENIQIEVERGDMIAIQQYIWSSIIDSLYDNSGQQFAMMSGINFQPNEIGDIHIAPPDYRFIPTIKAFYAKPFFFQFNLPTLFNEKNLNISFGAANVVGSNSSSFNIGQNSTIQKKLTTLAFAVDRPFKDPLYYDWYLNDTIEFSLVHDYYSDVMFSFYILSENWNHSKLNDGQLSEIANFLEPGRYVIHATASNGVSLLVTSAVFYIKIGISEVKITGNDSIWQNDMYYYMVYIDHGTNVTLSVDQGKGSKIRRSLKTVIKNGHWISFSYSYTDCGVFEIKAFAENDATEYPITATKKITVFCPLSGLEVTTQPPQISSGDVLVSSLSPYLDIKVTLETGSYAQYIIDWGDSSIFTYNSSDHFPEVIDQSHTYVEGTYILDIKIQSWDSVLEENHKIKVQRCPPPQIEFGYGTKDNPLNVTKEANQTILGRWGYLDSFCESIVENKFLAKSWTLTKPDGSSVIENAVKQGYSLAYNINPKRMAAGLYTLQLQMEYLNDIILYNAYFIVLEIPIYSVISSGAIQFVPRYKYTNGQKTFYDFKLSAEESFDPDESEGKLTYEWFCKVLSKQEDVDKEIAKDNGNYICLSRVGETIPSQYGGLTSQVQISTSLLLENIKYEVLMITSKGARSSNVKGEISVTDSTNPSIMLRCIENCGEKINVMKQVKYKYNCYSCPQNDILIGNWRVMKDSVALDESAFLTPKSSLDLVIKANALEIQSNYSFEYEVSYLSNPTETMYIRIEKSTSGIPYGGSCKVRPSEGYALEEIFSFVCQDWFNNEGTTTYDFLFNDFNSKEIKSSTTNSKKYVSFTDNRLSPFRLNASFPVGNSKYDYKIQILVEIKNRFQSYVIYDNITIKVYPVHFKNTRKPLENALESLVNKGPSIPKDSLNVLQFVTTTQSMNMNLEDEYASSIEAKPDLFTGQISEESKALAEKNKEKRNNVIRKVKAKNMEFISNLDVKSETDLFNAALAVQLISDGPPEYMDSNTMAKSVEALDNMVNTLGGATNGSGSETAQLVAVPLLGGISNLLKSVIENFKQSTVPGDGNVVSTANNIATSITNSSEKENVEKLMHMIEVTSSFFAEMKKVEEFQTNIPTDIFGMGVTVDTVSHLANSSLSAKHGSGFEISNLSEWSTENNKVLRVQAEKNGKKITWLQVDEKGSEFTCWVCNKFPSVANQNNKVTNGCKKWHRNYATRHNDDDRHKNLHFDKNPFVWLKKAEHLKTKLEGMSFSGEDGNKIPFETKKNLIDIVLKSDELVIAQNEIISLEKPFMPKKISLDVGAGCSNLLLDIKPLNDLQNETNLIVYIQFAKSPSRDDYDILLNISKSNGNYVETSNKPTEILYNGKILKPPRLSYSKSSSDGSFLLFNFTHFTYAPFINNTNQGKVHFVFMYSGPVPSPSYIENIYTYDKLELRSAFNYSFISKCASCVYANLTTNSFEENGVKIDLAKTTMSKTVCTTNHLTMFGGTLVAPNPLPPLSFALLKEGYVLLVTVTVCLLLWLLGLVLTRKADRKDLSKIGVCALIDNKPNDNYLYEITVNTGSRRHAETDSNVFIVITGNKGTSNPRVLKDPTRKAFQISSADVFIMKTAESLGDLSCIRVWHDNTGGGWYLRSIEIVDLQTDENFLFLATRWLAIDKEDGMVDCLVPVATQEQLKDFNYLFTTKARRDFTDAHMWYSIYARPPRSVFTRSQRLSVAISLLMTSMTASVMFYGAIPPGNASTENRIGGFSFTWAQVYVAFISACITVPISLILVGLFRSIKPKFVEPKMELKKPQTNLMEVACGKTLSLHGIPTTVQNNDIKKALQKKEKKKISLPHWMLIPTWVLCILVNFGCGFVVVWYGMALGNAKSIDWLASVTICLFQDIVLMQPVKVFLVALFVGLVAKKIDEEEKSETEKQAKKLAKDESWLENITEEMDEMFERVDIESLEPPDPAKLDWMREIRLKETKMYAIVREMILYLCFTLVVFLIGYLSREKSAFYQTNGLEELLSLKVREETHFEDHQQFANILSYSEFWPWMESLFLDEVFPKPWYKLDGAYDDTPKVRDFPGNIFLNDLNSKIVNGIRIRQVRIKPGECEYAPNVKKMMTIDCADVYSSSNEELRHFKKNWSIPYDENETPPSMNPATKPWRYQTWTELDGYPLWAELNTYYGGGYVIEVFPKWQNKDMLNSLKEKMWIDRYTRAVIIEFTIYNGATNYFSSITIVTEFPPGGGAVSFYQCLTFQLYRYASHNKVFIIAIEILFLTLMLIFTYREMKLFKKMRFAYFKEFWNLVEISNIFLTITAVVFYTVREILARDLLSRLQVKKPNVFINFQFAAMWSSSLNVIIALICFFVTLKFIKLLRFNRRISLMSLTMKRASFPLMMFGICFGIILFAVICSTWIIFGAHLYGYRDLYSSTASIVGLLLGKFSYEQFEVASRVLGPFFFMAFNVMVNLVIMNMMISILDDCYHEVQEEVIAQSNDYEIVDFVLAHLKDWFGLGKSKTLGEREWEERSNAEEGIGSNGTSRKVSSASDYLDNYRYLYELQWTPMENLNKASENEIEDEWAIFFQYYKYLRELKDKKNMIKAVVVDVNDDDDV